MKVLLMHISAPSKGRGRMGRLGGGEDGVFVREEGDGGGRGGGCSLKHTTSLFSL